MFKDLPEKYYLAHAQEIFDFVGVDPAFSPETGEKINAGGTPKNQAFQDFLMKSNPITKAIGLVVPQQTRLKIRDWLASRNMPPPPEMSAAARATLLDRLSGDIKTLEQLLDWDLSDWLR